VFRGGCFDLLHEGHIDGLRFAKEQGDILVVGVSLDERVRQRKGSNRPIITQGSRLAVINAISYVDYALLMPQVKPNLPTPTRQIINKLQPNYFVVEAALEESWSADIDSLQAHGTKLIFDRQSKVGSSSSIIEGIILGARL
jgi:D-beta-D-heptose 7-phosphate kinase/D-beta-D-heptose 1-phosphate adenosyltransferase